MYNFKLFLLLIVFCVKFTSQQVIIEGRGTTNFVRESDGNVTVCVTVNDQTVQTEATVHLASRAISAIENVDYEKLDKEISLTNENHQYCVNVRILMNGMEDGNDPREFSVHTVTNSVESDPTNEIYFSILDTDVIQVGFSRTEYTTTEGDGSFRVCVQNFNGTIREGVAISLSSLFHQGDYNDILSAGSTFQLTSRGQACTSFRTNDNDIVEYNRTHSITLQQGSIEVLFRNTEAIIFFIDNDRVGLGLIDREYVIEEGNFGSIEEVTFCFAFFTMRDKIQRNVTVQVIAVDGSATVMNRDYIFNDHSWIITTSMDIFLPFCINGSIIGDDIKENNKSFSIEYSAGPDLFLTANSYTVVILDDGDEATLLLIGSGDTTNVLENIGEVPICIILEVPDSVVASARAWAQVKTTGNKTKDLVVLILYPAIFMCNDVIIERDYLVTTNTSRILTVKCFNCLSNTIKINIINIDKTYIGFTQAKYIFYENDTNFLPNSNRRGVNTTTICIKIYSGYLSGDIRLSINFDLVARNAFNPGFISFESAQRQSSYVLTESNNVSCLLYTLISNGNAVGSDMKYNISLRHSYPYVKFEIQTAEIDFIEKDHVTLVIVGVRRILANINFSTTSRICIRSMSSGDILRPVIVQINLTDVRFNPHPFQNRNIFSARSITIPPSAAGDSQDYCISLNFTNFPTVKQMEIAYVLFNPQKPDVFQNDENKIIIVLTTYSNGLCSPLKDPQNGMVQITSENMQHTATYMCSSNFHLVPPNSSKRFCNDIRGWTGVAPKCLRSCSKPEIPQNGIVYVRSQLIGSEIHYSCQRGFKLIGPRVSLCQSNATWSSPPPECNLAIKVQLQLAYLLSLLSHLIFVKSLSC